MEVLKNTNRIGNIKKFFGLSVIAFILMAFLFAGSVSATTAKVSQISNYNDFDKYQEYLETKISSQNDGLFGQILGKIGYSTASLAKPKQVTNLVKVEYVPEWIQDGLYEFDVDIGTIELVSWSINGIEGTRYSADVGNDGVKEDSVLISTQRQGHFNFFAIMPQDCANLGGTSVGVSGVDWVYCDMGNKDPKYFNTYYSLSGEFTDSYGRLWKPGIYYKDIQLSASNNRGNPSDQAAIWAIRKYAFNQYVINNCQNKGVANCKVPVKFSSSKICVGGVPEFGTNEQAPNCDTGTGKGAVIHYTKFLADYECEIGAGNQMVVETFSGGKTVTMYSFRYPVHHFCPSSPVLVVDDATAKSTSNAKFYFDLEMGKPVVVPQSQTYVFYYVIKNNGEIPLVCKDNEAYDPSAVNGVKQCTPRTGIVFLCSEGVWDSTIHACAVTGGTPVCDLGVYDRDLMKCIWHPPNQAICDQKNGVAITWTGVRQDSKGNMNGYCPVGSTLNKGSNITSDTDDYCDYKGKRIQVERTMPATNAIFNIDSQKCEWTPLQKTECEAQGATYDEISNLCIYKPQQYVFCNIPGSAWDRGDINNPNDDKCIYYPPATAVCNNGGKYNNATGFCEVERPTVTICKDYPGANWNPMTGYCEYIAETKKTCGNKTGAIYDVGLDKCLVTAELKYVCDAYGQGAFWDPERKVCVKNANISWFCTKGTYDSDTNTCKVNVDGITNVCPANTVYIEAMKACVFYPEKKTICPSGYQYSDSLQACWFKPDSKVICPADATYNEDTGFCVREPQEQIYCPNGIYDPLKDKCVWTPQIEVNCGDKGTFDNVTQVCVELGDVQVKCEKGTVTTDELGQVKCVIKPVITCRNDDILCSIWDQIWQFIKKLLMLK